MGAASSKDGTAMCQEMAARTGRPNPRATFPGMLGSLGSQGQSQPCGQLPVWGSAAPSMRLAFHGSL